MEEPPISALQAREPEIDKSWRALSACLATDIDPNIFHLPSRVSRGREVWAEKAKKVCSSCPVAEPCLVAAIRQKEHWGVWGGTTPRERARKGRGADRTSDG